MEFEDDFYFVAKSLKFMQVFRNAHLHENFEDSSYTTLYKKQVKLV